jgi:hypothetical protein
MSGSASSSFLTKRQRKRIKMVLAVRISSIDGQGSEQIAHTLDITGKGARIGGLRQPLKHGHSVMVQRGPGKRKFRVVWVAAVGNEFHAGLEASEYGPEFWRLELPDECDIYANPQKEKRAGGRPAPRAPLPPEA